MIYTIFVIILLQYEIAEAVQIPAEIQKCSLSDSQFDLCMAKSITKAMKVFRDGSREFGIPPMEPLELEKLDIQTEPGNSVALNQFYKNVKLSGLSDSKILKFGSKPVPNACPSWDIEGYTPMTRMEADYSLTGQILVFPLNGHGKCNVTLYNITNHQKANCEQYTKNGKSYIRLKNYSMNMTVEKCVFHFENLFPGNEQISNEIEKTINENFMDIFREVKHGFEEVFSTLHQDAANNVFSKVPVDDLYLP